MLLIASIIQSRSQKSVMLSAPDKIISFLSCFARYAKCNSISFTISATFSTLFSMMIVPASNFVISSRFCTSVSILFSSCSDNMVNFFISGSLSASPCTISLYMLKAAMGVLSWCEISDMVSLKNSFERNSFSAWAFNTAAKVFTEWNSLYNSPSLSQAMRALVSPFRYLSIADTATPINLCCW